MSIVNLAMRRQAKAEELLVEAQVLAAERGHADIAKLVRQACALLTTPPDSPSNVVALPRRARAA